MTAISPKNSVIQFLAFMDHIGVFMETEVGISIGQDQMLKALCLRADEWV
jgi:hypothetical protein